MGVLALGSFVLVTVRWWFVVLIYDLAFRIRSLLQATQAGEEPRNGADETVQDDGGGCNSKY